MTDYKKEKAVESSFLTLEKICDDVSKIRVLCVGDIMLDRFVYGSVSRVSPEAPIPVLRQSAVTTMLGAVGNVARNVASLGAQAEIFSVIGDDAEADELQTVLNAEPGISGEICRDASRETTVKVRYVASGQQLLRVDKEVVSSISDDAETRLCAALKKAASSAQVILLSDYAKGCVTEKVIQTCITSASEFGIPVIVDPKGTDFGKYGSVDVIKPNASELAAVVGRTLLDERSVEDAMTELLASIPAKALAVTRSEKGMSFLQGAGTIHHMPAEKREVFDVSGAGDTSLAGIGLSLAVGATLEAACQMALIAAGIAVSKSGTATVSASEIREAIEVKKSNSNRRQRQHLPVDERIAAWRSEGLKIGFTNGCFDILHAGHIRSLEFAASHCDRLIVGLNSDASVKRLKGDARPINGELDRAELLAALQMVDAVMLFTEDTPYELIRQVQPDLIVKGGDYKPEDVVGADIVKARGGEVLIAPILEGRSTTGIIEKSSKT
ncbi:D-glycero-beta-D-manno-heptose 1-phosphate adenylyltransferase [Ponticaulis sp.]|uniref:D-glycero-beta-D-manno-heptose 1-phosphate adenylyltransferase n=1 Tax=Ponticaulis sp. TaxID=2020902 RepID=UPI000B6C2B15|nr:D-glycero-beta-D-manno-heptose 1-phosphate adenylyltransferase [Ponticaulis sp.]MAI89377.1 D-glycero-beta-D-manno-heptose 1-phosphate adenylyltransferase [Ponticaulis sp.]OUY00418.1 MAG: D-glycero-beta-D-manno-heptose 1-phosphate adenylyltransferase [Hyphomonadaceae bacterium TMED5]|tara:strand:+ start:14300 stop:15793 length:1494 start_codon:yes stop_codon:yes gene_type:complete